MSLAKQIKAVLIDLSGTLHIEDQVTPGAVQALKRYKPFQLNLRLVHTFSLSFRLRDSNLQVRFLTNTTKESKNVLHNRLLDCGFTDVNKSEIFTSLTSACQLLQNKKLKYFQSVLCDKHQNLLPLQLKPNATG